MNSSLRLNSEFSQEVVEVPKKRRHRKTSQVDKNEEKKKILLEAHPLSVLVTMKIKNELAIKIKFCYRSQLNIVTVTSEIDVPINITGECYMSISSSTFYFYDVNRKLCQ